MEPNINEAFMKLFIHCKEQEYKGWDNFDGLNSIFFNRSPLYRSALLRLIWIQFFKRSPVNFRPLTFVPAGYNAKGLALFISGLTHGGQEAEAKKLIDVITNMTCPGYSRKCWGYNFDWQARYLFTPAGTPNIVATVFVANALLDYFEATKKAEYLSIAINACEFILDDLVLYENNNELYFAYTPESKSRVHNINMLAAALLARLYSITQNQIFYEKSRKAMAASVGALNSDFSWWYGDLPCHRFIDNFHTGFNLTALSDWMAYTGESIWEEELRKASDFFFRIFWLDNGCPKYYHDSLYPIDIHCCAQGIITSLKLAKYTKRGLSFANKIANWTLRNMQDADGYFYYQKTKYYTNKIPYMRWSQAWMFYSLSLLLNGKPLSQGSTLS